MNQGTREPAQWAGIQEAMEQEGTSPQSYWRQHGYFWSAVQGWWRSQYFSPTTANLQVTTNAICSLTKHQINTPYFVTGAQRRQIDEWTTVSAPIFCLNRMNDQFSEYERNIRTMFDACFSPLFPTLASGIAPFPFRSDPGRISNVYFILYRHFVVLYKANFLFLLSPNHCYLADAAKCYQVAHFLWLTMLLRIVPAMCGWMAQIRILISCSTEVHARNPA